MANTPRIIPNPLDTWEDAERFAHRDLISITDPARLAAEAYVIEHRLAGLVYRQEDGQFIACVDGELIYEQAWLRERLRRLRALQARRAA